MPASDVTPRGLATSSCINEKGVVIGGDTLVLRPKKGVLEGNFLSYYINSHKKEVMRLVSGTTVFHLYGSDMRKMRIKFPEDINEQKAIANILQSSDAEINSLNKQLEYFQQQKKYLLNNLITGQIRTPENL